MRTQLPALLLLAAATVACGGDPEMADTTETTEAVEVEVPGVDLPDMIVAERGGFIPEGIEYDETNGRILVGSLSEGTVFEVGADGQVTPVVTDDELVSSVGIEVDEDRDRLLVANADRAVFGGEGPGQAKLGVYSLSSGERLAMVDLAAAVADAPDDAVFFVNDVTVADDGTAYATDTRMNVVYAVTPDYEASVLYRFQSSDAGLNGIVYHEDGYLLIAAGSTLYKMPLDAPEAVMPVTLPEEVAGQDGLVWTSDGRLAIVSNSQSRVVALSSGDDWATAEIAGVAPFDVQGTTAAAAGSDLFVVHPHFNDEEPPTIERVTLE